MAGYGYRGRYGSDKSEVEEKRGFVKVISARSWFLVIPLLGVVYANARQVTPRVEDLKKTVAQEEAAIDQERMQTLSGANRTRTHVSALAALGDTFEVRFARVDSLTQSIGTFLDADRKATAKLRGELDSLSLVVAAARAQTAAYSESLKALVPVIDSLTTTLASRTEETQRLWTETHDIADQADRILHPDSYRKKSSLVPGEGDYPTRDELPKR
jgi:hypothetical protein